MRGLQRRAILDRANAGQADQQPRPVVGHLEARSPAFLVAMTNRGDRRDKHLLPAGRRSRPAGSPPARQQHCDLRRQRGNDRRRPPLRGGSRRGRPARVPARPGVETLATLDGPFDLAFIDADKGGYVDYYEAIVPKLAPSGVIAADNTLFGLDGEGENATAIARFNEHVLHDDRVEQVLLPFREGLTLIHDVDEGARGRNRRRGRRRRSSRRNARLLRAHDGRRLRRGPSAGRRA